MTEGPHTTPRVAVLIPCYNEAVAIAGVVSDLRASLPEAAITVIDNNSSDTTASAARAAGAAVLHEARQGKGHAVRRGFADIDADIYLLIDGDGTYDAAAAAAMVACLAEGQLDMVTGARRSEAAAAYRPGHRTGNRLLTGLVGAIFGHEVSDLLSGYRAFSRRFVKSFPALAEGFETETEFTVHALELAMPIAELPTTYRERQAGSASKLNTWRDGMRILRTVLVLAKQERPLQLFSLGAAFLILLGLVFGLPVVATFMKTGLVPRLPTAILALGLVLLGFLALASGLILDSVARGRREMKRLAYLAIPGPTPPFPLPAPQIPP